MKKLAAVWCLALAAGVCRGQGGERGESGAIWDTGKLFAVPRTWQVELACSNSYGRIDGVEPVFIEGEPYRKAPTRVFAWVGIPHGACETNKAPGMVLLHGGGGTAFSKWVKTWNDRGYAAIAIDACGGIPQGERDGAAHPRHPWSGPAGWGRSFTQTGEAVTDQWTYHAVAAAVRAHSHLRSLPGVDAERTGLTGISWGGYLTSIVMGVDGRFKFCAPVYGCGFYRLNHEWNGNRRDAAFDRWERLWDPKNHIGGAAMPVLWCNGTNDRWYPLDALMASADLVKAGSGVRFALKLRMPHGHPPAGDPPEILAWAEHFLKGGEKPIGIVSAQLSGGAVRGTYSGGDPAAAELLYTASSDKVLARREWFAAPARFDGRGKTFSADVPAGATMFFVNLKDGKGLTASTRVFMR